MCWYIIHIVNCQVIFHRSIFDGWLFRMLNNVELFLLLFCVGSRKFIWSLLTFWSHFFLSCSWCGLFYLPLNYQINWVVFLDHNWTIYWNQSSLEQDMYFKGICTKDWMKIFCTMCNYIDLNRNKALVSQIQEPKLSLFHSFSQPLKWPC